MGGTKAVGRKRPAARDKITLTAEQKQMYAAERLINFRWIAKLCATRSSRVLTAEDRAPPDLQAELSELGQFAELAYSTLPIPFVYDNLAVLCAPSFPMEGFDALSTSVLVVPFPGLHTGYVAYRATQRQIIVAFAGTTTLGQAFHDLNARKRRYPRGRECAVHAGFWKLFKGMRSAAVDGIKQALAKHDVGEVVLVGHSMGAVLCYLLGLELITSDEIMPRGLPLKIATYGSPRAGDAALCNLWNESVAAYQTQHGMDSVKEYSIKAYNDGVHALPPHSWGFQHFCKKPVYLSRGKLYSIPSSESEHSVFEVVDSEPEKSDIINPRGGHNYYSERDLERAVRRLRWLDKATRTKAKSEGSSGWEKRYRILVAKYEKFKAS
ncbi:alpha/beta-hydrolase [Artomyces pyxidatus]|uniref:Alpha/beta-hydrolase n=1 Tax=Artomyces pyxidatus TaxID=48021 RepID=A0ACB8TIU0_9AGAM|nr:alpha/beta-hydrolase [Artomyces pyxidatus]